MGSNPILGVPNFFMEKILGSKNPNLLAANPSMCVPIEPFCSIVQNPFSAQIFAAV
jgi:hypothetical protein